MKITKAEMFKALENAEMFKALENAEMFKALENADELYKQYRDQQEVVNVATSCNSYEEDNGYRDIDHPLSVILMSYGNTVSIILRGE